MPQDQESNARRCGVTVVTGLPGSGKTTAVRSLAEQFGAGRVVVVSNELTRIGHDAALYETDGLRVINVNGECVTQRPGALAEAIDSAVDLLPAGTGRVIVETAGCGAIAPMLAALEPAGAERWSVDGVVSVFDARTVLDERLEVEREQASPGLISRGELIEHQAAAATANVLNFADQTDPATIAQAMRWLDSVNPEATIETTDDGCIRAATVIDPVWSPASHCERSPTQAPIRAMVYESRRPLHPGRLQEAIKGGAMLGTRSKGAVWLATEHDRKIRWDHCGLEVKLSPGTRWWASTAPSAWPVDRARWVNIFRSWAEPWGDRRQSLSIIGEDLDRGRTALALQACELTDAEMALGPSAWADWNDPLGGQSRLRMAS